MAHTSPVRAGTSRRTVVAAAGVTGLAAALAACGSNGGDGGEDAATPPRQRTPGSERPPNAGEAGEGVLASAADIPKGGGKVFADRKVVVTQPSEGEFKAFSAVCTHTGCLVKEVSGGTVNCPCHGSRFSVADGSVQAGPAQRPLPEERVTVEGGTVRLG
ncbi:Rieske (2Fe-2S) protein [Streptomyces sp. NPDC046215]|uniref:Cytochrome bc1 complex Rieske iron-sulfur subunit n=1 Tax=Streptomyces stramineus TaxID=173861 RepID=A0ABN1A1X4_9ACTN